VNATTANGVSSALDRLLRPGDKVYVAGSAAEPTDVFAWLQQDPARSAGLEITSSLVPGINRFEVDRLHPSAKLVAPFMQSGFRVAHRQGRFVQLPLSYSGVARYIQDFYEPDIAFCVVSPPDEKGYVSMGLSVEFTQLCLAKAARKVAVINSNMPFMPTSVSLSLACFDAILETSASLPAYDTGTLNDEACAMAAHVASLIEDGSALQVGLGKVPQAIMRALVGHKGLRIHSGMLSDGIVQLAESGALDLDFDHMTCVLVGTQQLYDWAANQDLISVRGCDQTHDPLRIATIERFVAVNSALTVDLFGQCDLETAGGRVVSGAGGAPDFSRGARHSRGGISVIAVPSTYPGPGGVATRIVPQLGSNNLVAVARGDVDVIATEHGLADLRGKSVNDRAEAIISVAAPEFRAELESGWRDIRYRM
jgi:acyl-CoA hydrolase